MWSQLKSSKHMKNWRFVGEKHYRIAYRFSNFLISQHIKKIPSQKPFWTLNSIKNSPSTLSKSIPCCYNIWSLSEGTYLQTSSTLQFKIRQRSFSVLVEISLLCFNLWSVLCDIWCLLVSVYQFSFDFSSVSQKGE